MFKMNQNKKFTTKSRPSQPVRKKEDGVFDMEQHFILRMPPGPAIALRRDVEAGVMNLKDKLNIELQPAMRHGKVTYGGQIFSAKLVDMPAMIDTLKTTDRKTFYKAADIAQMLICISDDEDSPDDVENPKKKDAKDKKYQWNHGITPSLKNVRKRRFRKTLKKKYQEQPDIEKEVKRLFRMDNEAIDVKWEVVVEDDKALDSHGAEKQVLAHGESHGDSTKQLLSASMLESGDVADLLGAADIFGELSSSDDEDKDVDIMGIMEDESSMTMTRVDTQQSLLSDDYNTQMTDTNMSADGDTSELIQKLRELEKHLEELKEKLLSLQMQLAIIDNNDALKEQLQAEFESLLDEENKTQKEYEILSSMLNQS